jgi:hypothetical protein
MRSVQLTAAFLLSFGLLLPVSAAEPEGKIEVQVGVTLPFLSDIPYVGRFFRNMAAGNVEACDEGSCEIEELPLPPPPGMRMIRTVGADGLERIGIDFDCESADKCPNGLANPCRACSQEDCDKFELACQPGGMPDAAVLVTMLEAREEMRVVLHEATEQFRAREQELLAELHEALLTAAVREATLKARDEAAEKTNELTKELVSTLVENAKLNAKLELAEEKAKMLAELHEARVELAALKARDAGEVAQPRRSRGDAQARRTAEAVR